MSTEEQQINKSYVPIKTKPAPQVESLTPVDVSIEDVTSEPPPQPQQQQQEVVDEPVADSVEVDLDTGEKVEPQQQEQEPQEEEQEEAAEKEAPKKAKKPRKPRKSRAKERIQQLSSEKTQLAQELQKMQEEKAALQKQLQQGTKESKATLKENLEKSLETTLNSMADAIENGDAKESVRLNEEMTTIKMQLAGLTSELNQIEKQEQEQPKEKPQQQVQQPTEVPEKALDWIEDHPEFKTDELFYVAAMTVSNQLVQEGFDDQSDDFYDELDERLSPRFPEVFGIDEKNVVDYTEDSENSSEGEDVKAKSSKKKTASKRQTEQTVSGASRTPIHQKGANTRGKNSVVLDPLAVQKAERWGLSLEQYARRVAHNEENRRTDGYVPIKLGKDKK